MIKFRLNKISRDNTIARMERANIAMHYKILTGAELAQALKAKLVEEAQEVVTAENRTELVSELADLLEVFEAVCQAEQISQAELLAAKNQIKSERGGFERGIFTEYIEMTADNSWIDHFRKTPDKYPEF